MESVKNLYKESIWRLVEYVGLSGHGMTQTVTPALTTEANALYFQAPESSEWKAFLASLPPKNRHAASVRRRLSARIRAAVQADLCLWCWFARSMCFCSQLERKRALFLSRQPDLAVKVTIVMHVAEVLRSTNSGHIAAFILDAPIHVWGVGEEAVCLQELSNIDESDGSCTALLYPGPGATLLEDFLQNLPHGQKTHLLLSDGTWNQANALNRHISQHIPRVMLRVDESHTSLFKGLRKRTRETGVSTLEAIAMALEQSLTKLNSGDVEVAKLSMDILIETMKEFVDLGRLLKHQTLCFSNSVKGS